MSPVTTGVETGTAPTAYLVDSTSTVTEYGAKL
jgi:hypothetical protein